MSEPDTISSIDTLLDWLSAENTKKADALFNANDLPIMVDASKKQLTNLRSDLEAAQSRLKDADENLLSMVNQYCANKFDEKGVPIRYSHDFMSTGEAAFEYLTDHGLAKWAENGVDIYDLKFPSANPEMKK